MFPITPTEYLDSLLIDYTLISHRESFTAQETAHSAHIKGNTLSKVIVVSSANKMSMIVIPANYLLHQIELSQALALKDLTIVPERDFAERFAECETGAMPPFGRLYGMEVFVARELAQNQTITFNGGTHNLLIKMRTIDFIEIANARIISLGYHVAGVNPISATSKVRNWHKV